MKMRDSTGAVQATLEALTAVHATLDSVKPDTTISEIFVLLWKLWGESCLSDLESFRVPEDADLRNDRMGTSGMITKEELAARIAGREYGKEVTREDINQAKQAGLVIAFGASDDILELRGAINDEIGAWEGALIQMAPDGKIPPAKDQEVLKRYGAMPTLHTIEAIWSPKGDLPLSWLIKTDLPSAPFTIMEDGDPFCVGVVFELPAVVKE